MTPARDTEQLLAAAEAVAPTIVREASAAEAAGRIGAAVLDALHEHRLFRLWIPKDLDGEETDLVTALRIYELLSRADGAAGWTLMIGAGAGLFAGFLDRAAAAEIFLPPNAVIAGSGAATGVARRAEGGYIVSGRWKYASGARHATWFTANCVIENADGTRDGDMTRIRSVAVPADAVRIHDTWSVTAMRGTGSDDIEIEGCLVPSSHTFSLDEEPTAAGPLYRVPFASIAELSFAAVSLGIARHALEAFRSLAAGKIPLGGMNRLTDDADVQLRYAHAEAIVGSARAYTFETAESAWETILRGDRLSAAQGARVRLAAVDTTHRCATAVDLLYARAGMNPLFASSELGRAWRDIHAVTQNIVVSAGHYGDAGRALLE